MKKLLRLLLVLAISFSACKKDTSITLNDIVGQYSLTQFTSYNTDNSLIVNAKSADKPCMHNSKLTFKKDHTATSVFAGNDVCKLTSPSDPVTVSFEPSTTNYEKWTLVNNEVQLQLTTNSEIHHYTITRNNGKIQLTATSNTLFKTTEVFTKD